VWGMEEAREGKIKMTEEEAHKKWCPMVRTGLVAGMAVNRHISGDVHDETRCIGRECMMFRNELSYHHRERENSWYCGLASVGHD
jgi:hypothetical protein